VYNNLGRLLFGVSAMSARKKSKLLLEEGGCADDNVRDETFLEHVKSEGLVVNVTQTVAQRLFCGPASSESFKTSLSSTCDREGETSGRFTTTMEEHYDRLAQEEFKGTQEMAKRSSELSSYYCSMLANVVGVNEFEAMATTVGTQKKFPPCVNGAGCSAFEILTTTDGRMVSRSVITPFMVMLTGDERRRILDGEKIPGIEHRQCVVCYVRMLLGWSSIVDTMGEPTYRFGRHSFIPFIIAQTLRDTDDDIELPEKGDVIHGPSDVLHTLSSVVKGVPFSYDATAPYVILNGVGAFRVPIIHLSICRWKVIEDTIGDTVPQLQLFCGHMVASACRDSRYGMIELHSPPSSIKPRVLHSWPYEGVVSGIRGLCSKEELVSEWVQHRKRHHGVDQKCEVCSASFWNGNYRGTTLLTPLTLYLARFFGCSEEKACNIVDIGVVLKTTFKLMSGVPCTLPKNFRQRLASIFFWLSPRPDMCVTLQRYFYENKRAAKTEVTFCGEDPVECYDIPLVSILGTDIAKFAYRKDVCPSFLQKFIADIGIIEFSRVILVCMCYNIFSGDLKTIPEYAFESGIFFYLMEFISRDMFAVDHCKEHSILYKSIYEVLSDMSRMMRFCVAPYRAKEAIPPLWKECGYYRPADRDAAATLKNWAMERTPIHELRGPILVYPATQDVVDNHRVIVKRQSVTPVCVCVRCGGLNVLFTSVVGKKDKRDKSVGYDENKHYYGCKIWESDPICMCIPSHGVYFKFNFVWWVRCTKCCQVVEVVETSHSKKHLHVCLKCAAASHDHGKGVGHFCSEELI
jgi:hypothetical protein